MILMIINFRPRTLALLLRKAEMKRSLSVQDVPCVADLLGREGKKIEDHFQQFSSIVSYHITYVKPSYFHNTAFQIITQLINIYVRRTTISVMSTFRHNQSRQVLPFLCIYSLPVRASGNSQATNFFTGSYLIDCIQCTVRVKYQMLMARSGHYKQGTFDLKPTFVLYFAGALHQRCNMFYFHFEYRRRFHVFCISL